MVPDTIRLHPEFTGSSSDVTLLAGSVGFRVNKAMLAMASPVFARMVRDSALTADLIVTDDEAADLYAFLKLMRIGPSKPVVSAAARALQAEQAAEEEGGVTDASHGEEGGREDEQGEGEGDRRAGEAEDSGSGPKRPPKSDRRERRERKLSTVKEESERGSSSSSDGSSKHTQTEPVKRSTTPSSPRSSKSKPLSESQTANTPSKPRILVSRPGTGVKALDRALREAQAKALGIDVKKKKKTRVRFQDSDPPPVPQLRASDEGERALPPSHPFQSAVPRSSSASSSSLNTPTTKARSGSASSGSGYSGIEVTVEPPSPPRPIPPSSPPTAASPAAVSPAPAAFDASITQLLQIHALTQKYPGFYTHAVLDFHVELNAPGVVASLGSRPSQLELFRLLELTHRLRSSRLWSLILGKLASEPWWRAQLDPWSFGEVEVGVLGQDLFSVLSILAAVHVTPPAHHVHPHRHPTSPREGEGKERKSKGGKGRKEAARRQAEGVFSQVDKVCITYDEGELCEQ